MPTTATQHAAAIKSRRALSQFAPILLLLLLGADDDDDDDDNLPVFRAGFSQTVYRSTIMNIIIIIIIIIGRVMVYIIAPRIVNKKMKYKRQGC